jgi:hypothetical protein
MDPELTEQAGVGSSRLSVVGSVLLQFAGEAVSATDCKAATNSR